MTWIKFPNQINDLLKLRAALRVAIALSPSEISDDGIYGEALLAAGVIRTSYTPAQMASLPYSRQPHRTTARGLRQMFILLGCMEPTAAGVRLTQDGRRIARQSGLTLAAVEHNVWLRLVSDLRFPHAKYPNLSPGVSGVRPTHVLLAMLLPGPLPAQGLAFAFGARDESPLEIKTARARASQWSSSQASALASAVPTTVSELRNNAKVFPGLLEQLGLIRRDGGMARLEPPALRILGTAKPGILPRQGLPRRRPLSTSRPVNPNTTPWVPKPIDATDLAEKAALQLVKQERANQNHQSAVKTINDWLISRGFHTVEADYDILARRGATWLLLEVKSIATSSARSQVVRAIGQLAYYAALSIPRPSKGTKVIRAVVFDQPLDNPQALAVLKAEGIQAIWIDGGSVRFADPRLEKSLGP